MAKKRTKDYEDFTSKLTQENLTALKVKAAKDGDPIYITLNKLVANGCK